MQIALNTSNLYTVYPITIISSNSDSTESRLHFHSIKFTYRMKIVEVDSRGIIFQQLAVLTSAAKMCARTHARFPHSFREYIAWCHREERAQLAVLPSALMYLVGDCNSRDLFIHFYRCNSLAKSYNRTFNKTSPLSLRFENISCPSSI